MSKPPYTPDVVVYRDGAFPSAFFSHPNDPIGAMRDWAASPDYVFCPCPENEDDAARTVEYDDRVVESFEAALQVLRERGHRIVDGGGK